MNPFAFFWNHLNPITVRELRRNNRPRGIIRVLAVLYVLALLGYTAVLLAYPPARAYRAEIALFTNGLWFVWAGLGSLATVSASSRILALPDADPLLKLIGMSPAAQVRGYFLALAFYAACAAFLPVPFILVAMGLAEVPAAPVLAESLPFMLLLLLHIFLGTNATAAYFFSFYIQAQGRMQRFLASFVALFSPIVYAIPFILLSFGEPFDNPVQVYDGIAVWIYWGFLFVAMFTTGYLLSVYHFRRPFEGFGWSILRNFFCYFLLHCLFFVSMIVFAVVMEMVFRT